MTFKHLLVVAVCSSLLGVAPTTHAEDDANVRPRENVLWRAAIGFSPVEKLEFAVERIQRALEPGEPLRYTLIVTNHGAEIVGLIEIENDDSSTQASTGRGFGFVTLVANVDGDTLFINGEPVGTVTPNPQTGRYQLGFELVSSHPLGVARGRQTLGDVFAAVLDEDDNTQAYYSWKMKNVLLTQYNATGSR